MNSCHGIGSLNNNQPRHNRTLTDELKREAFEIGADAVVGVDLSYQEIGATGSTMLFVVVTGIGVRLMAD